MNQDVQKRLFVPLRRDAFEWFATGRKTFELRRAGGRFAETHVRPSVSVELRRGYSGVSIWGFVGRVFIGEDLSQLLNRVDYKDVIPRASSLQEAVAVAREFVGGVGPFILFEVLRDDS
jgi:hypothetical protein